MTVYVLSLHAKKHAWVRYDLIYKGKYLSSNTCSRVILHTTMSQRLRHVLSMNVYINHHVTRMNACVTKIHTNECVMSQIHPSLHEQVYKYTYINGNV